jgi:hypothetical protein
MEYNDKVVANPDKATQALQEISKIIDRYRE